MASPSAPDPIWASWLDAALQNLQQSNLLRSLRPVFCLPSGFCLPDSPFLPLSGVQTSSDGAVTDSAADFQTFDGLGPWDRPAVEMEISQKTFQLWLNQASSTGEELCSLDMMSQNASSLNAELRHKLVVFSGSDYLGLSVHPTVRRAAAKAALEFGMGPRASPLVSGYTYHHRLLESALADLTKTQDCLLFPTGFAANTAIMTVISNFPQSHTISREEYRVAFFSDALNHASIIDGLHLAQRQRIVEVNIYRHCDMDNLDELLASSNCKRKVVVTDSLFSMDGDFAPMLELAALRRKYRFLLIVDDAHGTLLCGRTGGGVSEAFDVEGEVDIIIGSLSKALGSQGGFIACSQKWKQLLQSRGRSFIYSTALPVPVVAAAYAAILVARKEKWRQASVWEKVKQLSDATGMKFTSPIIPIIIGQEAAALKASKFLLQSGFHVTAIRPPTVPANSSRLRITLSAAHTVDDVKALSAALAPWIKAQKQSILLVPFQTSILLHAHIDAKDGNRACSIAIHQDKAVTKCGQKIPFKPRVVCQKPGSKL